MTYVLGSLGSLGAAPTTPPLEVNVALQATGLVFDAGLRPVVKAMLLANAGASDWKIFNAVRFNEPNISNKNAETRAGKQDYIQPYKSFRDALNTALSKIGKGKELANALRFHLYQMIANERSSLERAGLLQPPKTEDKSRGGTASTPDNTMLYVGAAALVALIVIGAAREKKA